MATTRCSIQRVWLNSIQQVHSDFTILAFLCLVCSKTWTTIKVYRTRQVQSTRILSFWKRMWNDSSKFYLYRTLIIGMRPIQMIGTHVKHQQPYSVPGKNLNMSEIINISMSGKGFPYCVLMKSKLISNYRILSVTPSQNI